jgi:hypothetical protein
LDVSDPAAALLDIFRAPLIQDAGFARNATPPMDVGMERCALCDDPQDRP